MTFEILKRVDPSEPALAAMSMQRLGRNTKPSLLLFLRGDLAASAGMSRDTRVRCHLGRDEHAGLLRLEVDAVGGFVVGEWRRGGLVVDLGYVAAFGNESREKLGCKAERDGRAIVVTLPAWARSPTRAPAAKEIPGEGASGTSGTKSAPPTPVAPTPPAPASAAVTAITGINVDRTPGAERIVSGRGGAVDVSKRGAHLVELLLRANGQPIDESFLATKLWAPDKPPPTARVMIDTICRDLKSLSALGLEVRRIRGVGVQLVVTS